MIKIFVADDHPLIREGLRKTLLVEEDFQIVGEAADGFEVMKKIRETEFDILLLDLNMPGKNGLTVIKEIKQILPKASILVLSMYPLQRFAVRALKTGASGYVTKDSPTEELIKAIRTIISRGRYISIELAELLANEFGTTKDVMPHETLSDREFQIMSMITTGKTVKEIAEELCLNISTVNTYHARILEKMNMKSNVELTLYAIENNLIDV
ncbi:MAG: response regulator transcription factor [Bacteroidota bacterium]|nr:response regulator transcription factor [Bacteroidota bacterium]MDP4194643.1 response regulator transcription factor [Bacteroidota bacterium]